MRLRLRSRRSCRRRRRGRAWSCRFPRPGMRRRRCDVGRPATTRADATSLWPGGGAARAVAPKQRESSAASRSAAWCPRLSRRSGSAGTNVTHEPPGRATVSATTSAATLARRRSPRSFHAATRRRTGSSYSTAARALTNASLRPAHSAQRRTGQAVGAPQRSQRGGPMRRKADRQHAHTCAPRLEQMRQRWGSSRSSTQRR